MSSSEGRALRIATRRSPLALWQAEHVSALLDRQGVATEIIPLVSGGDAHMRPIDGTRQVGVFTKRIQEAVLAGDADVAVHSMKDLPTEPTPGLMVAAVPERESVRDCLVTTTGIPLNELPERSRVGTGSRRRAAQLLRLRPDLQILPIRGNVQTRLEKLHGGEFEAIVLAEAGLRRLGMGEVARAPLTLREMLPAPGQGALAIETREDDGQAAETMQAINAPVDRLAVTAERLLLSALHGGCLAPVAAHAEVVEGVLQLTARVLAVDGSRQLECEHEVAYDASAAESVARLCSEELLARGARELIETAREPSGDATGS